MSVFTGKSSSPKNFVPLERWISHIYYPFHILKKSIKLISCFKYLKVFFHLNSTTELLTNFKVMSHFSWALQTQLGYAIWWLYKKHKSILGSELQWSYKEQNRINVKATAIVCFVLSNKIIVTLLSCMFWH